MARKKVPLGKEFTKGLVIENPVLRLVLGTCPTLAVTTSASNGLAMGLAATLSYRLEPGYFSPAQSHSRKVRIPAFITIIAGFVTIVQLLMQAYLPRLNESLASLFP